MATRLTISTRFQLLVQSLTFIKNHYPLLFGLGLIAALGRVAQLGGFGDLSAGVNFLLEVIVESSRVLIFLFVLGIANIQKGFEHLKRLLTGKVSLKAAWTVVVHKTKHEWVSPLLSFIAFILIAGVINFLIDQLAYQTCLLLSLKTNGILTPVSTEWTILLFFKNILVIPFTLVFETMLILWMTQRTNGTRDSLQMT